MRIDGLEVEFSGDEEEDCFHGLQAGVSARADFLVLDANPLNDIANTRRINKVYLRGQEIPRPALSAKWQAKNAQPAK